MRLAIAGQIQALGEDEEVAAITENRVNGLSEPQVTDRFEPILEPPNSPPLSSHSLSPSPSLSSSPTLASSPSTSFPSLSSTSHASTSMQDLQELMQDPANRVCADCGAPGPSWVLYFYFLTTYFYSNPFSLSLNRSPQAGEYYYVLHVQEFTEDCPQEPQDSTQ